MSTDPIRIGPEQERKAHEIARAEGTSPSDVANRAIDRLYDDARAARNRQSAPESLYDALVRAGSLGVVDGMSSEPV
ncbi:MAG TPA: hypothetical protein PLU35_10880 [Phycisphaerales bacterium]|nr:hypothetical protein [Phycisphaerales bacterium]